MSINIDFTNCSTSRLQAIVEKVEPLALPKNVDKVSLNILNTLRDKDRVNDTLIAEWFATTEFGKNVRVCEDSEDLQIYHFNGIIFERISEREVSKNFIIQLEPLNKPENEWVKYASNSTGVRRVLHIFLSLPSVCVSQYDFNTRRDIIVAQNGIYDLHTNTLLPHTSDVRSTCCLTVGIEKNEAKAQIVHSAILRMFEGRENEYELYRFLFYRCMIPVFKSRVFFSLVGKEGTGKSTLMNCIMRVLGKVSKSGYALSLKRVELLEKIGLNGPNEGMKHLPLARLLMFTEVKEGFVIDASMTKAIVECETLNIRGRYRKDVDFTPQANLVFTSNYPLHFAEGATVLDKMYLIQPTWVVPKKEQIPFEEDIFAPNASAYVWSILDEGYRKGWYTTQNDPSMPERVKKQVESACAAENIAPKICKSLFEIADKEHYIVVREAMDMFHAEIEEEIGPNVGALKYNLRATLKLVFGEENLEFDRSLRLHGKKVKVIYGLRKKE